MIWVGFRAVGLKHPKDPRERVLPTEFSSHCPQRLMQLKTDDTNELY